MRETLVPSLGWEDPLEKDMATPLQYSCLENPIDRGAWWAIYKVHGVAESQTWLSDFTHSLLLPHISYIVLVTYLKYIQFSSGLYVIIYIIFALNVIFLHLFSKYIL